MGGTAGDLPGVGLHPNIAVKISGGCTLSHEAFPYNDIWDPLCRIFDAFGFDRCLSRARVRTRAVQIARWPQLLHRASMRCRSYRNRPIRTAIGRR